MTTELDETQPTIHTDEQDEATENQLLDSTGEPCDGHRTGTRLENRPVRTDGAGDRSRAVVLASGGMDSATVAYEAAARGYDLFLVHTTYGQNTADREFECARALADAVEAAEFRHVETDHLARLGTSSLTDDDVAVADAALVEDAGGPTGDDASTSAVPDSYVPFRNANLLAMAIAYAETIDAEAVFVGAHSEDYSGYPDCRPGFFEAFQRVVDVGTAPETEIAVAAPFVEWSKTDIAEHGLKLGVPYEKTWSCYREEAPACGTCDACAYRLQAFQRLGERDPIEYSERPTYHDPHR